MFPPVGLGCAAMKNLLFLFAIAMSLFASAQNTSTSKAAAPDVYAIRNGFVDAHGVMIYYETFGRGKPLLIVHGGPGASHDYFLPYLVPLARHYELVFIDER